MQHEHKMPTKAAATAIARLWLAALALGCVRQVEPTPAQAPTPATAPASATPTTEAASAPAATPAEASETVVADSREAALALVEATERELLAAWIHRERSDWVKSTHLTFDTELLAAQAEERVMALVAERAAEAQRYAALDLPAEARRKLMLLRLAQTLPSPPEPAARTELAALSTAMGARYGKAKVCVGKGEASTLPEGCHTLDALSRLLAESDDHRQELEIWERWHATAATARTGFVRYVELANQGARAMGFADLGALWRSGYDMPPEDFVVEVDRLWRQVEPLYRALHCYARARLRERHGDAVPADGPIPAHLLGNMWAQDWLWRIDLLRPEPKAGRRKARTLTDVLVARKTTPEQMIRHGEAFFVSLGLAPLPATFLERSLLARPRDREVVCHASAWNIDWRDDLRVKMCIEINEEDFVTVHHELGHNYYQRAYKDQPPLFTNSANDGFHEALGDTIALSVTPAYLEKIGLSSGEQRSELNFLMQRAVEKIAFLPFGLLVDKWRWQVFAGTTTPQDYNAAWWQLRRELQGVSAPSPRDERFFDPGAKYHVAGSVPYMRYFLAHILQFQLHRALCKVAGHEGPLHLCSIHGSEEAGARLQAMMQLGLSRPWQDALEVATGERAMDASAVLDYFAPLKAWLDQRNQGERCGW